MFLTWFLKVSSGYLQRKCHCHYRVVYIGWMWRHNRIVSASVVAIVLLTWFLKASSTLDVIGAKRPTYVLLKHIRWQSLRGRGWCKKNDNELMPCDYAICLHYAVYVAFWWLVSTQKMFFIDMDPKNIFSGAVWVSDLDGVEKLFVGIAVSTSNFYMSLIFIFFFN